MKSGYIVMALIATIAAASCTPQPLTPPPDAADASPAPPSLVDAGSPCARACATLDRIGCAEGRDRDCERLLEQLEHDHLLRNQRGAWFDCDMVEGDQSTDDVKQDGLTCRLDGGLR